MNRRQLRSSKCGFYNNTNNGCPMRENWRFEDRCHCWCPIARLREADLDKAERIELLQEEIKILREEAVKNGK